MAAHAQWWSDTRVRLVVANDAAVARAVLARDRLAPGVGVVAVAAHPIPAADETILSCPDSAAIRRLLVRWRPLTLPAAVDRQVAAFGGDVLGPLLMSLRERLVEVLADAGRITPGLAHRIAGLAGIVGFADVSARWEAVSCGDDAEAADALRETRLAVAALDRTGHCRPALPLLRRRQSAR